MSQSKIFLKNRALGYVSNHIPLVTRYIQRRKENLIVTCVGRSFHTYGCSHFTLLSVSGTHPGDITCLAADTYHIYTASENNVYAWRRGTELKHTYKGHDCPVHLLLPFGAHLISVDENSNIKIWDIKTEEIFLELNFGNEIFKITTILHPNTYINKILLGSEQGSLQLWNIKTTKVIYTFKGWSSPITALEQAPALDVAAIGLANGRIKLHNLRMDETIFELIQDWGFVTSISFRTDGNPIMATGTMAGHVLFWNLEERRIESQITSAHFAAIAGLKCLPNEPLVVSSSPDNSLKLWIFDQTDGGARLLRIREGHAEPPTSVRFYGADGHNILTAGRDSSLRIFSTITETFNKSLGRASFNRKSSKKKGRLIEDPMIMPPIVELAAETTREKEWDNIAAAHLGLGVVTTWSYDKLKMGEHKLITEYIRNHKNATATCLCITQCGNFVVVGYNIGNIERFNIQSGIHRASYGLESNRHKGSVRGVIVDSLNQVVLSAGEDALLKFWPFKPSRDHNPRAVLDVKEPVKWLRSHRENSLIALALDDFSLVLVDIDTRVLVRRFEGHRGYLTDATFSPDARWLVTASMDCTVKTWDIPSGQLVDAFKVPEACISLHFSPTGEFLVTAHVCNLGIHLWSNKTLYSHVSLKAISPNAPVPMIGLPRSTKEIDLESDLEELSVIEKEDENEEKYVSPEQLDADLITMSSLANSRWQNLLNIDIVKKRNKPKEAPKAPESAPFFLPTIPALNIQFDISQEKFQDSSNKILVHPDFQNLTQFGTLLRESMENEDFSKAFKKLKSLGPSAIDFEIQSLSLDETYFQLLALQFMKMIKNTMESKKDFELCQAYLSIFLKIHGSSIAENKQLWKYLPELQQEQSKSWITLREKLFYNLSVVQHLKKM
ncbi:WD repeat-containing protein 36 [Venturia canescens]|uniref:WD repeat-containing protein 36 n=1 Tax=Venturia canescens TaxID=32260 RepID=UPI001C9C18EE|nr:WD repeat-containing protein 36 [Venturia canescens]